MTQARQLDSTFEMYAHPQQDWEELSEQAQREVEEELQEVED
jgi:hypothetical protein